MMQLDVIIFNSMEQPLFSIKPFTNASHLKQITGNSDSHSNYQVGNLNNRNIESELFSNTPR